MPFPRRAICILACLLLCLAARGGRLTAGTFHSLKGVGVCFDYVCSPDLFNAYTLYADLYSVLDGSADVPGLKAFFAHYTRLAGWQKEMGVLDLYAGPGVGCGYVRDHGSGERLGLCTSLAGAFCARYTFDRGISIDLGVSLELGVFSVRRGDSIQTSLYKNGLLRSYLPHIRLMYCF